MVHVKSYVVLDRGLGSQEHAIPLVTPKAMGMLVILGLPVT